MTDAVERVPWRAGRSGCSAWARRRCCSPWPPATGRTATRCTSCASAARPRGATSTSPRSRRCSAHAVDALTGGSLVGLRIPSALMAGLVVVLTGLLAAEFGGGRRAQVIAAASAAVSSFLLATGAPAVDDHGRRAGLDRSCPGWSCGRCATAGRCGSPSARSAGIGLENKLPARVPARRAADRGAGGGPPGGAAIAVAVAGRGGRARAVGAEPGLAGRARVPDVRGRGVDRGGRLGEQPALVPVPAVPAGAGEPVARARVGAGLVAARAGPGARHVAGVRACVGAAGGRVHGDRRQAVLRRGPLPGAAGGGRRAGGGVDPRAPSAGRGCSWRRWRSR